MNKTIDGLLSHSVNTTTLGGKTNPKIPFNCRHFNRPRVVTSTSADTVTQEQFKDDMDINRIVAMYSKAGLPLPPLDKAVYGIDVPTSDFAEFSEKLNIAKQNFMSLPSSLRQYFDNDVNTFARFLNSSSDEDVHSLLNKFKVIKDEETPAVSSPDVPNSVNPSPSIEPVNPS